MSKPSSAVLLIDPKYGENVGGAIRACAAFAVPVVRWTGSRVPSSKKVARYGRLKAPTGDPEVDFDCATTAFADLLALGLTAVAVEVSDEATPLPSFTHPERALYVFGPEDGTLSKQILAQCAATVLIPTQRCLNLAAAVNIVLYDRCSRLSAP